MKSCKKIERVFSITPWFLYCLSIALLIQAFFAKHVHAKNDQLVVHIECTAEGKPKRSGSGVLISPKGHVLTAKHVVQEGYSCSGGIGSVTVEKRPLEPITQSFQYDAMVLKLDANTPYYASYCPMDEDMKERRISAYGFHGRSKRDPSVTSGIISTVAIESDGSFETDAMTIGGKSGGPVFLEGTDSIVAIIKGGQYDPATGDATAYKVMAAEVLADIANFELAKTCGQIPDPALLEREETLQYKLKYASGTDRELLERLISVIWNMISDPERATQARDKNLETLRKLLGDQFPKETVREALAAFNAGETGPLENLLAQMGENKNAKVLFANGIIALDNYQWIEAYNYFVDAATLDPTVEHLTKAVEMSLQLSQPKPAIDFAQQLVDASKDESENGGEKYIVSLNYLGLAFLLDAQPTEAELKFNEALILLGFEEEKTNPFLHASILTNLASTNQDMERFPEAERKYAAALKILREALGANTVQYAIHLNNLGSVLLVQGHSDEAEEKIRSSMDIFKFFSRHPSRITAVNNLAVLSKDTGKYHEAIDYYRMVQKQFEDYFGTTSSHYTIASINLARALELAGNLSEAKKEYSSGLKNGLNEFSESDPIRSVILNNVAGFMSLVGCLDQAEGAYLLALDISKQGNNGKNSKHAENQRDLAALLGKRGKRIDEALDRAQSAKKIYQSLFDKSHKDVREANALVEKLRAQINDGLNPNQKSSSNFSIDCDNFEKELGLYQ